VRQFSVGWNYNAGDIEINSRLSQEGLHANDAMLGVLFPHFWRIAKKIPDHRSFFRFQLARNETAGVGDPTNGCPTPASFVSASP
jgi:hypothetical protein